MSKDKNPLRATPRQEAFGYFLRGFAPRLSEHLIEVLHDITEGLNDSPLRARGPENWTQLFDPLPGLGECTDERLGTRFSGWECVTSDGLYGWTFIPYKLRRDEPVKKEGVRS